jgi:hypothetical protein
MNDISLTERQRSMLCWLAATEGKIPRGEGIEQSNSDLSHEIKMSLVNLSLVNAPVWAGKDGYIYEPTEAGYERAARLRYGSGCPACVTAFCVCRVRIVCVAGCGNAGCHGSHD